MVLLTRREVRHAITRLRNVRVAERGPGADEWPIGLSISRDSLDELLIDGDPDERETLDFEGLEFMGIPLRVDPALEAGDFVLAWPDPVRP